MLTIGIKASLFQNYLIELHDVAFFIEIVLISYTFRKSVLKRELKICKAKATSNIHSNVC